MIHFTADTHFGHEACIRHCSRPWPDAASMNEALIEAWNKVVGDRDTVFHLGDFSFIGSTIAEIAPRLNGQIHLLLGNHDKKSEANRAAKDGFIATVGEVHYLRWEGMRFWLSHYAHRVWPNSHHGSLHLFGHSHGDIETPYGRSMDVGVDNIAKLTGEYRPVSFDEVVDWLADPPVTNHHPEQVSLK